MKNTILLLVILKSSILFCQDCKPDEEKTDKISKQEIVAWKETLYESGFGNSLINTSDWYITFQFARYNNNNLLTVYVEKYEESAQNAAFESQSRGEKGKDISLGFTQGQPLKITVESASTASKMNNVVGKLVTTIKLTSRLKPEQMQDFKKAFDGGTLNAVRILLANNMYIEKDVKEKRAKKLAEKFQCFSDYNNKNPIKEQTSSEYNINSNVPENLPRDKNNKVTFEEVIAVDSASKDQLFQRAKSWMVNYYKNEQLAVNNSSEGQLIRSGSFIKVYTKPNGKTESETHTYNITIKVKDGKYKYNISDIILDDGKTKTPLEDGYASLEKSGNTAYKRYIDQQIYTGITDVLSSLKSAMLSDSNSKSDF